jgi:hypothetical protein
MRLVLRRNPPAAPLNSIVPLHGLVLGEVIQSTNTDELQFANYRTRFEQQLPSCSCDWRKHHSEIRSNLPNDLCSGQTVRIHTRKGGIEQPRRLFLDLQAGTLQNTNQGSEDRIVGSAPSVIRGDSTTEGQTPSITVLKASLLYSLGQERHTNVRLAERNGKG